MSCRPGAGWRWASSALTSSPPRRVRSWSSPSTPRWRWMTTASRTVPPPAWGWLQLRRRLLSQGDDGAAGLVDLVDTRRGSHSGVGFSRGNTFPATCVPHGMSFLTPLTDARTLGWLYRWHGDPRPRLRGVALSHQPSPWIGERGALQVMPFAGEPVLDPEQRALGFSHDDEVAHPDYYAVALDGGIRVEMTPTSRTAALRVHLPADGGITLDQPTGSFGSAGGSQAPGRAAPPTPSAVLSPVAAVSPVAALGPVRVVTPRPCCASRAGPAATKDCPPSRRRCASSSSGRLRAPSGGSRRARPTAAPAPGRRRAPARRHPRDPPSHLLHLLRAGLAQPGAGEPGPEL